MIYDIERIDDNDGTRNVYLSTALADYDTDPWNVCISLNSETGEITIGGWCLGCVSVPPNDVPLWCKRLYAHLEPRIMEMLKAPNPKPVKSFIEKLADKLTA